jgi:hypothetical protein
MAADLRGRESLTKFQGRHSRSATAHSFDEAEDSGVNGRKLCIACYRFVICCWRQSRGGHDLVIGSVAKIDETVDIFRLQGLSGAQAQ